MEINKNGKNKSREDKKSGPTACVSPDRSLQHGSSDGRAHPHGTVPLNTAPAITGISHAFHRLVHACRSHSTVMLTRHLSG